MVRMTARASATKEEMAATLVGRFHSLANAHGLVRRSFAQSQETRLTDLAALVADIVQPHERTRGSHPALCHRKARPSSAANIPSMAWR